MATTRPPDPLSDEELRAIYGQSYVNQYDPHAVARIRRMLPLFALYGQEVVTHLGCGNGVLLELIVLLSVNIVGVDFSQGFVRAAERRRDAEGS